MACDISCDAFSWGSCVMDRVKFCSPQDVSGVVGGLIH